MSSETDQAVRFDEQFRAVYLAFHRRDRPRSQLPAASRAVLEHLALSGPLTIGEAARHLRRAQSVISDIVSHLERDGLLEREPDPADRRRTLVWLTGLGHQTLRAEHNVLGVGLLTQAMSRMAPGDADALIDGLATLVRLAPKEISHDM